MIESYDLEKLLKSYGINPSKLISKNNNILTLEQYLSIKQILEYLVNELGIEPKNIEKSPSVFFIAPENAKTNYEFLKNHNIKTCNINKTLHILSSKPVKMQETYYYILKKYGLDYINKTTLVLRSSVERIKKIEKIISDFCC